MKKSTLVILILLATNSWYGCTKDSNKDLRDPFISTYSVTETWTENSRTLTKPAFTMSVEKSTQHADMLLLNNFANYGAGVSAEASITGYDISIPQQILPNSNAITGSGTLADTTLTITYTETIGSSSFVVVATAKKR